jgi:hypothetical protein
MFNNLYPNQTELNLGKIILIPKDSPNRCQRGGVWIQKASLAAIFAEYTKHPDFFNSHFKEKINIITGTNEILGVDLEGRVCKKGEKVIVNTHNIYLTSKFNEFPRKNILTPEEFTYLLQGCILEKTGVKKVKVFKEGDMDRIDKKYTNTPCIIVLSGEKYLKDPAYYCNELNYIQPLSGFEKNGLLRSRTLQEPLILKNFIKHDVTYFRQTSPLIEEPLIIIGADTLFEKYQHRIIPMILTDGEIVKEIRGKTNFFEDKPRKTTNNYFLGMSKKFQE